MNQEEFDAFIQAFRKRLILKDQSVNDAMLPLIPEEEKQELLNQDRAFVTYIMELRFGEQDDLRPYFIFGFMNQGKAEFILYSLNLELFTMYEIEAFSTVCIGAMEQDSWQNFLNQMYLGLMKNYASQQGYEEIANLELPERWKDPEDREDQGSSEQPGDQQQ
jgi:hypothetical protein